MDDVVYRGACVYENMYTGETKKVVGKTYTSRAPATAFKNRQAKVKFYYRAEEYNRDTRQWEKTTKSEQERMPLVEAFIEIPTGWQKHEL